MLLPTRELAVQVHDVLAPLAKAVGLRIAAVYGGADVDRQVAKLRKGVEVVIATPGRLIDLGDRGELSVADVEVLVLDEADRMADMGFMPQVEWVLRRLERPHQTLLFSATLDGAVDRLVTRYLTDPVHHEVASSTQTVAAMEHRFLQVHQMDKVKVAAAICRAQEKVLVFVRTKRGADRLVEQLEKEGSGRPGSTATCARSTGSGPWPTSLRASCTCWWPPTWPPAACTSRASTWSSTTTRPRTTRPTCTARAARPGPARPASWPPWPCGTRSSRPRSSSAGWGSHPHRRGLLRRPPAGHLAAWEPSPDEGVL